MKNKYSKMTAYTEEIIAILWESYVFNYDGMQILAVCKALGDHQMIYFLWRRKWNTIRPPQQFAYRLPARETKTW